MNRVVVGFTASSAVALLVLAYVTLSGPEEPVLSAATGSAPVVREVTPSRRSTPRVASPNFVSPRETLAQRRAALPEWDEGDEQIAWVDASELGAFAGAAPALVEANDACMGLLRQFDDAVANKRKLRRGTKDQLYRETREALAELSSHVDVDDPEQMSLLEETRAQLMLRMKKLEIEPPVGG